MATAFSSGYMRVDDLRIMGRLNEKAKQIDKPVGQRVWLKSGKDLGERFGGLSVVVQPVDELGRPLDQNAFGIFLDKVDIEETDQKDLIERYLRPKETWQS